MQPSLHILLQVRHCLVLLTLCRVSISAYARAEPSTAQLKAFSCYSSCWLTLPQPPPHHNYPARLML